MTRFFLLVGGVVVVVLLGLMLDAQSQIPVHRAEAPADPRSIFAPGRIEGATPQVELRFRLSGQVEELLVEEGQTVPQGAVLARLDDAEYEHEVALAEAELHVAEAELERLLNGARTQERTEARSLLEAKRAELERARLTWNRIRELSDRRAVSLQEADNQRTRVSSLEAEVAAAEARVELLEAPARADDVAVAEARIAAANARLEQAKVRLRWTELRAPTAGQILRVGFEAGELTAPDSLEPVIVMVDTSKYQVRAFVEELDAPRVRVGMPATVTADGLGDQEIRGRVVRLSPRMSRKSLWSDEPDESYDTKTREVWIELERSEPLVVGLRVDVHFSLESEADAAHTPDGTNDPSLARHGPAR